MANRQSHFATAFDWSKGRLIIPIISLCIGLLSANARPEIHDSFKFPLGTIQSDFYKISQLEDSSCFATRRIAAMQSISAKSTESVLDSALYNINWGRFDKALEMLDRCLSDQTDPNDLGFIYFNQMIAFAGKAANAGFRRDMFEARICAKQALNLCSAVQFYCGKEQLFSRLKLQLHWLMGDVEAEISELRRLSTLRPGDVQLLKLLADYSYRLNQNDTADSTLIELHSLGAMSASDWALWAKTQFRLKQYDNCIVSCDSVPIGSRERNDLLKLKGTSYYWLDKYEEASPILTEVVRLDPTDEWSWFRLGYSLRMIDDCDHAINAFRAALRLSPKWDDCYRNMARCAKAAGNMEDAVTYAESAVLIDSDDFDSRWLYAWLLQESGKYEQAISAYKATLDLNPNNSEIWYQLSTAYWNTDKEGDMFAALDSVLKYDPSNIMALRLLGAQYFEKGEHRESLYYFTKLVEIDNQDAEAWARKSVSEYLLGYYDESLMSCNEALKIAPNRTDLRNQKHEILLKLGRKE